MKKIFVLVVTLTTHFLSMAQLSNFDLSTYKLPKIKRHTLSLDLGGSGSGSKSYLSDKSNSGINSNLNLYYKYYKNSEKWQIDDTASVTINMSKSKSRYNDNESYSNNSAQYYERFTSINRFYFVKKLFIEANYDESVKFSNNNINQTISNELKSRGYSDQVSSKDSRNIGSELSLGFGYGRIEQVQDAQLAVYILKELQDNGKLSHDPSQDEILALSSLITQLKNKRLFDYRKKHIYQMEQIDSLLQANNLIANPDMKYSAIVVDNWDYSYNPVRLSGFRATLGSSFRGVEQIEKDTNSQSYISSKDFKVRQYTGKTYVALKFEQPINLHWQQSASVSPYVAKVSAAYEKGGDSKGDKLLLGCDAAYKLSFYPNSRTTLSWNNSASVWKDSVTKIDESSLRIEPNNKWNYFASSGVSIDYYISPRVRLNYSFAVQYVNLTKTIYDDHFATITGVTANQKYASYSTRLRIVYNIL